MPIHLRAIKESNSWAIPHSSDFTGSGPHAEARQSGASRSERNPPTDHMRHAIAVAPATATTRSSHFALLPVPAFDGKPIPPAKPSVNSRANISRLCRRRRALLG